ncbi:hypothetical protein QR98_0025490 [Sarcoptes scabiei]|uniref:Uncharacterized protein n=1 Tax=Sarcoptes scabiei TaxID=52283 RepID=A0A132A021_SARSC|nr:hypothetical protein QR98_0025490 [Sarcoptes scabiei]
MLPRVIIIFLANQNYRQDRHLQWPAVNRKDLFIKQIFTIFHIFSTNIEGRSKALFSATQIIIIITIIIIAITITIIIISITIAINKDDTSDNKFFAFNFLFNFNNNNGENVD